MQNTSNKMSDEKLSASFSKYRLRSCAPADQSNINQDAPASVTCWMKMTWQQRTTTGPPELTKSENVSAIPSESIPNWSIRRHLRFKPRFWMNLCQSLITRRARGRSVNKSIFPRQFLTWAFPVTRASTIPRPFSRKKDTLKKWFFGFNKIIGMNPSLTEGNH